MGLEEETTPKELEFIITIRGREGEDEANINMEFDPPMSDEHKAAWENSGTGTMASILRSAIQTAR